MSSAASSSSSSRPVGAQYGRADTEFVERYPGGGYDFKLTKKQLKEQRSAAWELIKEAGRCLLEGRELVSVSMPVQLFEPRSFLQRLVDGWVFAPALLNHAAALTDPLERFKLVMAFHISSLPLTVTSMKPFNPILGETFQASFADGTQINLEQVSHHPPRSMWEMTGPNNSYYCHGDGVWSASCVGNTVRGSQKGPNHVDFPDGQRVTCTTPDVHVNGILMGDRYVEFKGKALISDAKNDLHCELEFAPDALGFFKGLFKKAKSPSDTIRGVIYQGQGSNARQVGEVSGSWLGYVDVDGHRYWDIRDAPRATVIPLENPMQSDSRFREDLRSLLDEDLKRASEYKRLLEEKQRYDRRLREKHAEVKKAEAKAAKKKEKADKKESKKSKDKHVAASAPAALDAPTVH